MKLEYPPAVPVAVAAIPPGFKVVDKELTVPTLLKIVVPFCWIRTRSMSSSAVGAETVGIEYAPEAAATAALIVGVPPTVTAIELEAELLHVPSFNTAVTVISEVNALEVTELAVDPLNTFGDQV